MWCILFPLKVLSAKEYEERLDWMDWCGSGCCENPVRFTCRSITSVMTIGMEEKPKLSILKEIAELKIELRCAFILVKKKREVLMTLRGGTAAFQIEVGRWKDVKREGRVCKECQSGEAEDVCH